MDEVIKQFGINWKLVAAETVNFIVVLGILYYFVFRKISVFLDERRDTIKGGVENAEKATELLASAESEKEGIITDAQKTASETIADSVAKGKEREASILSEADTKAQQLLDQAKAKGEQEKEGIIASSKEEIAKMITLGAEKVLSSK